MLIKGGAVLEMAQHVNTVVFDTCLRKVTTATPTLMKTRLELTTPFMVNQHHSCLGAVYLHPGEWFIAFKDKHFTNHLS